MKNEDQNEDFYEETSSKMVYVRSSASDSKIKGTGTRRGEYAKRDDTRKGRSVHPRQEDIRKATSYDPENEYTATATINLRGKKESQSRYKTFKEESPTSSSRSFEMQGRELDSRHARSLESKEEYPVYKWRIDYDNKNYVRSMCNKPQGLHRYGDGRLFDWDISYDNKYYLQSKLNAPKGLHRHVYEYKRKKVPDDDILADATGWEFEYGPEFCQVEGDIPYYPRERIVGKGGYRFYDVKRNSSDCDRKVEESPEEIKNIDEEDYKYGHEFFQDDVPHIVEFKDMRIGRGGFRYIDVERNKCDVTPKDVRGIDYRESQVSAHSYIEEEEEAPRKGKPFKQTILKKTFRLIKPPSPTAEDFAKAKTIKYVPGTKSEIFHEEKPARTRQSSMEIIKDPSKQPVLSSGKKPEKSKKHIPKKDKKKYDEKIYKAGITERSVSPTRHYSMDEILRDEELGHQERKRRSQDDYRGNQATARHRERQKEGRRWRHRCPPDVEYRITEIRNITRDVPCGRSKHDSRKGARDDTKGRRSIDWRKHELHPYDEGNSVTEEYEKYVNDKGDIIWVKTEETRSEFHHKKQD